MRYLTESLKLDLSKKMVLLAGPRQCGKTTLAKSLMNKDSQYFNWDIPRDRKILREQSWSKSASLVIFDEIHKAPKWKNFLKAVIDEFQNDPPVLVTGSAKLDAFRNSGDALTGRTFFYRLHPIDLQESKLFLPNLGLEQRTERLLQTGGFPEAFLNPREASRLRMDRFALVLQDDLRDLTLVSSWRGPADLLELLRERVGKPVSFDGLSQDLRVSPPTVKAWVELLEKLYLVFLVAPYSNNLSRGIRKEKRVYFFDCGAAENDRGASLENLVACSLLKWVQYRRDKLGENWELAYLRDKEKREIDFVLVYQRKPHTFIEVKSGDESPGTGLLYYNQKFPAARCIQLVLNLDRTLEKKGIQVLNLGQWLEKMPVTSS